MTGSIRRRRDALGNHINPGGVSRMMRLRSCRLLGRFSFRPRVGGLDGELLRGAHCYTSGECKLGPRPNIALVNRHAGVGGKR